MILGNAAAAHIRLIVWCRDCGHPVEPAPAEVASRYGSETSVPTLILLDSRHPTPFQGVALHISPKVETIIEDSKLLALPREAIGSKPITYFIRENDL
jgi:hypothetical protein